MFTDQELEPSSSCKELTRRCRDTVAFILVKCKCFCCLTRTCSQVLTSPVRSVNLIMQHSHGPRLDPGKTFKMKFNSISFAHFFSVFTAHSIHSPLISQLLISMSTHFTASSPRHRPSSRWRSFLVIDLNESILRFNELVPLQISTETKLKLSNGPKPSEMEKLSSYP